MDCLFLRWFIILNVTIVSDGEYGDRTYETIKNDFNTKFIAIEPLNKLIIYEDIQIQEKIAKKLEKSNILILYINHPDLLLTYIEYFYNKVDWIIVPSWRGNGLKNNFEAYGNVTCPYIMCELEKNGNPYFDEFVSKFGKPIVEFITKNGKINDINVIRTAPCGSTKFVADFLRKNYFNKVFDYKNLPQEAGFKIQHYPCRATKLRLFSDEEDKKQLASTIHRNSFKKALDSLKNG
jgi:hypothetical protein